MLCGTVQEEKEKVDLLSLEVRKKEITEDNWNSYMNLKRIPMINKGQYRGTIINLIRVLIAISALVAFLIIIGLLYLTVAIEGTVIFLTFLPRLYEKVVSGERIFNYREKSNNKNACLRVLDEIDKFLTKQI